MKKPVRYLDQQMGVILLRYVTANSGYTTVDTCHNDSLNLTLSSVQS
jgi:hypothetical protein